MAKPLWKKFPKIARVLTPADEVRRGIRKKPKNPQRKKKRPKRPTLVRDRWYYLLEYHYKRCPKGNIDGAFLEDLCTRYPNCPYCDRVLDDGNRQLEHLTPISRGGTNTKSNVIFACSDCNARKFTQNYDEYMKRIGAIWTGEKR